MSDRTGKDRVDTRKSAERLPSLWAKGEDNEDRGSSVALLLRALQRQDKLVNAGSLSEK